MNSRKRYAIVGTGGRSRMFTDAITERYAEQAELVGFCDASPGRMDYWNAYLGRRGHEPVPTYPADRFDEMVGELRPDTVIVTTRDAEHHRYIIRAMELGCDAISEKPMTIDAEKCQAILDAIARTGRRLRVTFNYRFMPTFSKVKEIVDSGAIGKPTLVDFQWRLDTSHGADYFRRWHREKKHSGGLLVHKSTHHFDLVNWILGDYPQVVTAMGDLAYYGRANAEARGESRPYPRYTGHVTQEDDPFALVLEPDEHGRNLYLDGENDPIDETGGYIRDRNVFGGEDRWPITAEDTMAVQARYHGGTLLSYTLVAYCPWEGERLTITGTAGQVEYFGRGAGHLILGQSEAELAEAQYQGERYIRLQRMFGPPEAIEVPKASGGHGGGDQRLLDRVFLPEAELDEDPLRRDATHVDGARSILTGIAANQSIATGSQPVKLDDLVDFSVLPGQLAAAGR